MPKLSMPKERKFGWELKPISSVYYGQVSNKAGQLCVVLEHSLLRGVTAEMIVWWFKHFANLKVTLDDVEGYENSQIPAYWLWHPFDHIDVQIKGNSSIHGSLVGRKIQIQEAMQYDKYGLKYPVDNELTIFYCDHDGWGMGKQYPFFGKVIFLRISFKDVYANEEIIGTHYHYEVVVGTHKQNVLTRAINKRIVGKFTAEFWEAWITHNTIEVGTFENFLPPLYAQRNDLANIHYSKSMNPITNDLSTQKQIGFDKKLFEERLIGYEQSDNAFVFQQGTEKSILK